MPASCCQIRWRTHARSRQPSSSRRVPAAAVLCLCVPTAFFLAAQLTPAAAACSDAIFVLQFGVVFLTASRTSSTLWPGLQDALAVPIPASFAAAAALRRKTRCRGLWMRHMHQTGAAKATSSPASVRGHKATGDGAMIAAGDVWNGKLEQALERQREGEGGGVSEGTGSLP